MDLTADAAEDSNLTFDQRLPQFGLLACESNQFRRTLERDDGPGLGAVGAEEIAVVIVVEDHDRDPTLLTHGGLDSGNSIEADLQNSLLVRARPLRDCAN